MTTTYSVPSSYCMLLPTNLDCNWSGCSPRARWLGHKVYVEADVEADGVDADKLSLREATAISREIEESLSAHLPALGQARVRIISQPQ